MKKLALLFAGAMVLGSGGAALAQATLTVPGLGSADAGSAAYILMLDGSSDNPVADGYIGADAGGNLQCGPTGGPFNDDGSDNGDYVANGCDPTTLIPAP